MNMIDTYSELATYLGPLPSAAPRAFPLAPSKTIEVGVTLDSFNAQLDRCRESALFVTHLRELTHSLQRDGRAERHRALAEAALRAANELRGRELLNARSRVAEAERELDAAEARLASVGPDTLPEVFAVASERRDGWAAAARRAKVELERVEVKLSKLVGEHDREIAAMKRIEVEVRERLQRERAAATKAAHKT